MQVSQVLAPARKHIANDSARLCLADAVALYDEGAYDFAKCRALESLKYSVGVFHADYKSAAK